MARARGFDEADAVRAAAELFTRHGYEGTSVDDLVNHLGIHRGSLYRTFGSKLALFHIALRSQIDLEILPWIDTLGSDLSAAMNAGTTPVDRRAPVDLGLLLIAAIELSPIDPVVAAEVERVFTALEGQFRPSGGDDDAATAFASLIFGLHLRMRAGLDPRAAVRAAVALSRAVTSEEAHGAQTNRKS
jgi:TetR/AcrR family transcriptional repressor of nem operon